VQGANQSTAARPVLSAVLSVEQQILREFSGGRRFVDNIRARPNLSGGSRTDRFNVSI
jgi:hypothetical protein